jgi:hypothetical protein
MCATNIPLKPPRTKKYKKSRRNKNPTSRTQLAWRSVTHQCKTLVEAGTEIITVIVL